MHTTAHPTTCGCPHLFQLAVLAQQAQRGLRLALQRGSVPPQRPRALGHRRQLLLGQPCPLCQPVEHVFRVFLKILVLDVQAHAAAEGPCREGALGVTVASLSMHIWKTGGCTACCHRPRLAHQQSPRTHTPLHAPPRHTCLRG